MENPVCKEVEKYVDQAIREKVIIPPNGEDVNLFSKSINCTARDLASVCASIERKYKIDWDNFLQTVQNYSLNDFIQGISSNVLDIKDDG